MAIDRRELGRRSGPDRCCDRGRWWREVMWVWQFGDETDALLSAWGIKSLVCIETPPAVRIPLVYLRHLVGYLTPKRLNMHPQWRYAESCYYPVRRARNRVII